MAKSFIARALSRQATPSAPRTRDGTERLDLVLPSGWPENPGPVTWRWQRRGKVVNSGELDNLSRLPADARNAPAYVWTPAAETVLTTARLPTRSPRKIVQALPYALEDRLLGDPDSLHFAWRPEADGQLSVAVTARQRVKAWISELNASGLRPVALCPATLLVPWAEEHWSLAFLGSEVLVRTGAVAGFVCPLTGTQPPPLLVTALQEAARHPHPPSALVVFHAAPGFSAGHWSGILGLPVRTESRSLWERQADSHAPLNLLQGQYERRTELAETLRPYRIALVLASLWLISSFALDVVDWWQLRRDYSALRQSMTQILQTSFPETRTILDPAAQMQKAVDQLLAKGGQGDQELLPMLAKMTTAMQTEPRARLRSLRYSDKALTLELVWPAPATPEAWKNTAERNGLRVEVLSLSPRANEVEGRLRLTPATVTRSGS